MKINRVSSYAVHALAYMASQKADHAWPSHDVAHARGIPERFLLKVLKPLVGAGILTSVRGPHGGYRLARPPEKITLLDILEAVDGSMVGQAGDFEGKGTGAVASKLQAPFDRAAEQARGELARVRLSDLAGKGK